MAKHTHQVLISRAMSSMLTPLAYSHVKFPRVAVLVEDTASLFYKALIFSERAMSGLLHQAFLLIWYSKNRVHCAANMSLAGSSTQTLSFPDYSDSNTPQDKCRQPLESAKKRVMWRKVLSGICTISLLSFLLATAALSIAIGLLFTNRLTALDAMSGPQKFDLGNCGSSWQEAEAKGERIKMDRVPHWQILITWRLGCVFDVMATDWVRAECKHKELSDVLFAQGNWTFYRDAEATQIIPHEELLKGRISPYYTKGAYHFSHCAYVWHKHVRSMGKESMLLDSKSRNWEHSLHCLYMLAKADTSYISNKTSSKTVLGQTKTGDSVSCVAALNIDNALIYDA
ncbi:uncharacterized protein MYCFIDRAFT_173539 [Pseudocercospora fijiensis CIRAD86]|uniref:Uncharacterized protein n=1 Tax=Pseudocercospora fijiensis (strain CIRAD86) TaxID=383855 RepID=M3B5E1_PSEFD|nr:uncharacterized protein MYCFIDRAFT_173539 [Pseudocercospora fijiensis CIRAD86]EME84578.1 hypothetical protein MYCFIDRAFT_173539 [Pseudocercospora fijiensis CIRAD86]